jgi:putative integral membrane protein (TIGR02587 family)
MSGRSAQLHDIEPGSPGPAREKNRQFAIGLARAFSGALLFAFPMLMTMEMWWLGFYVHPLRLVVFILLNVPLLVGLSYYAGFEETGSRLEDVLDAFIAYAVGFVVAALTLWLLAIVGPDMSANEIIGKIAIQAVPASMGAMLTRSQFGEEQRKEERRSSANYEAGLFLMAVGALYLSASLASTEEMVLIAFKMTAGHVIGLVLFSLGLMQGFLYAVVGRGKTDLPSDDIPFWHVFFRYTVVGYAIALLISYLILWIFGRTAGLAPEELVQAVVVVGFPAALGAGAARLIL